MDQILKIEEDTFKEEQPVKIKAMPKNSFLKGDKFRQRISAGELNTTMTVQKMWM